MSNLSFNYTQTKVTNLSRLPANMNSIGEVCKGLGTRTPTSFAGNHSTTVWLWWTQLGWRQGLQAILCLSGTSPNDIFSTLGCINYIKLHLAILHTNSLYYTIHLHIVQCNLCVRQTSDKQTDIWTYRLNRPWAHSVKTDGEGTDISYLTDIATLWLASQLK